MQLRNTNHRIKLIFLALCTLCLFLLTLAHLNRPEFFPENAMRGAGLTKLGKQIYSESLSALEESPIWNLDPDDGNIYRLTILPTWGSPHSIRLNTKSHHLHFSMTDGSAGYDVGELVASKTLVLDKKQVLAFKKMFEDANFFEQPIQTKVQGLDGETWLLEALVNGNYHILVRWTPRFDTNERGLGKYVTIGDWLLNAAGSTITRDH